MLFVVFFSWQLYTAVVLVMVDQDGEAKTANKKSTVTVQTDSLHVFNRVNNYSIIGNFIRIIVLPYVVITC